jgi:hypothetical protein
VFYYRFTSISAAPEAIVRVKSRFHNKIFIGFSSYFWHFFIFPSFRGKIIYGKKQRATEE